MCGWRWRLLVLVYAPFRARGVQPRWSHTHTHAAHEVGCFGDENVVAVERDVTQCLISLFSLLLACAWGRAESVAYLLGQRFILKFLLPIRIRRSGIGDVGMVVRVCRWDGGSPACSLQFCVCVHTEPCCSFQHTSMTAAGIDLGSRFFSRVRCDFYTRSHFLEPTRGRAFRHTPILHALYLAMLCPPVLPLSVLCNRSFTPIVTTTTEANFIGLSVREKGKLKHTDRRHRLSGDLQ